MLVKNWEVGSQKIDAKSRVVATRAALLFGPGSPSSRCSSPYTHCSCALGQSQTTSRIIQSCFDFLASQPLLNLILTSSRSDLTCSKMCWRVSHKHLWFAGPCLNCLRRQFLYRPYSPYSSPISITASRCVFRRPIIIRCSPQPMIIPSKEGDGSLGI